MDRSGVAFSGGFCILLAALLLTVPLPWLLAGLFAAVFHELGHLVMIYLLGGRVRFGSFGLASANLYLSAMDRISQALAALGGPLFSLLLVLFWRQFPRVAICSLGQLCYNLLPLYPMDGGRILSCLVSAKLCKIIASACRISLCILTLWLSFGLKLGVFPMLLALLLLIRTK